MEGKNKESVRKGKLLGAKTVQGKGVRETVWEGHRFIRVSEPQQWGKIDRVKEEI